VSLRNDKGSAPARIISPNNCSCSKSLSIVSANITTWQYTNMRDGLVANIDLANHNKESYAYMSNGLVADRLSHACPTSPLMSKLSGRGYTFRRGHFAKNNRYA